MEIIETLKNFGTDFLSPVFQVAVLFLIFYALLKMLKGTNGIVMITACVIIAVFFYFCGEFLGMEAMKWISIKIGEVLPILLILVFQAEIRRFLLFVGRHKLSLFWKMSSEQKRVSTQTLIDELVDAVSAMTMQRQWHDAHHDKHFFIPSRNTGALIAIATRESAGLNEYIDNGVRIDAPVNSLLLRTIFYEGTPLHDGGVIIRDMSIVAASCQFPLSQNTRQTEATHTRHLAALGLAESTRALVLVVSEETGNISAVKGDGTLQMLDGPKALRELLGQSLGLIASGKDKPSVSGKKTKD